MYASFFGLQREPFSIAPDPRYLFMSERHREALAHLVYGLGGGGGFVLLTGEIGAGKTTVCRCFLEQIPPRCNVAYIFNPKLTVPELLRAVCDEFRIPYTHRGPGSETVTDYVDPLNEYLLRTHAVGQNNVLIIDEAQMLSADVLEQLRLLTNLETNERKLLQIVLIGQPELRELLARPELEQLAQRVIARFHLQALSEAETAQYIEHRLGVAGLSSAMPFERKLMPRIHQLTRGVPRRINLLCDRALLGAYAGGQAAVSRAVVEQAAQEVFGGHVAPARRSAGPPLAWLGAGAAGALGLVLLGAWALQGQPGRWAGRAAAKVDAAAGKAAAAASSPAAGSASATTAAASPASAGSPGLPMAAASVPQGAAAGTVQAPALAAANIAASGATVAAAQAASSASALPFDLSAAFASLPDDRRQAWRELLPLWGLVPGSGDPCDEAARARVLCDSHPTSLAMIRLLDRPGVLTLRDGSGRVGYALLTGLGSETAKLRFAGSERQVPLASLAAHWRGDFSTLWRTPPGYGSQRLESATGSSARWLAEQLARLQAGPVAEAGAAASEVQAANTANTANTAGASPATGASLKSRIYAFQVAQGLQPDGLAGPFTFMQLNRASGVDEPRLQSSP